MTPAFWCVFVAGLLPYAGAVIAKAGKRDFDNSRPREWLTKQEGYRQRANAAQMNSFEAFPFFAAAVIIAHVLHGPQPLVNLLAFVFTGARVLYILLYLSNKATFRSLVWGVGFLSVVGIFVVASL
jgi:uncharacterized MAPEG superfamily protein